MAPKTVINDDATFRAMWVEGKTYNEIAEHFGCSKGAVNRKVSCMDLTRRGKGHSAKYQKPAEAVLVKARSCPEMPDHPKWSRAQDESVWATKGEYSRVNLMAAQWRVPIAIVTQRWHQLRAAA